MSLEADLGEGGSPLVSSLLQAMAAPSSSSRSSAHMQVSTGVLASCSPPHMYRVSPIMLTPCEDLCEQQYHYRVFHMIVTMAPGHGPAPL